MFPSSTLQLLNDVLPQLPRLVMERSLAHDIDDLTTELLPGVRWAVVDDAHTAQAAGDRVCKALKKAEHVTFSYHPAANDQNVDYVRQMATHCDALMAVGSGTINDICKYAAALDGKPYVVFPTAASMNGYLSANASISVNGYKKTVQGHMPKALFCDVSVITAAPVRLTKSGFGDSIARSTAQADWLLSHLLLGTPYNETPFTLLASYEPELLATARGIAKGDSETIALLMKVLLLSGLGMTIAGGSYPASQAEHMIAHAYNMHVTHTGGRTVTLHGEEIAVTALAIANRQEVLLSIAPIFADRIFPEARVTELFGETVMQEAKKAYEKKLEQMNGHDIGDWESIAARIQPVTLPPSRMQAILSAAECNTFWGALGWQQDSYLAVSGLARFLRERFTFLDLI
jgi:glycerol-1-phosphate dehydrogenase [NAD(P)+]